MGNEFHYIYKLTNIHTGEFYYGSRTCKCNPNDDTYMGSMKIWKPNKSDIIKEIILSNFNSREDALKAESILINETINHPLNRNYSSPDGKFIRLGPPVNKGKKNPNHSKRMIGENNPNFGKKLSLETRNKMSKSHMGKVFSEETKTKMRKPKTETHILNLKKADRSKSYKTIIQYDLDRNFIREWNGIITASNELKIGANNINSCLKGKYKSSGGFIWKYKQ
jgi:hypothetical protein